MSVSITLSSCTCAIFSKQFHLWATLTNLIKILEIENDKLFSAMKATQMASILATLSNTLIQGLKEMSLQLLKKHLCRCNMFAVHHTWFH